MKGRHTILNACGANFRASSRYRLIPMARLPRRLLDELGEASANPDLYGVLVPRGSATAGYRTVTPTAARLLKALANPGPIPELILAQLGLRRNEAISKLVLDGALELCVNGGYRSGPDALKHVVEMASRSRGEGRCGRLSVEALRYGQHLDISSPRELSRRLYRYNAIAVSPRLTRTLPDADSLRSSIQNRLLTCATGNGGSWIASPAEGDESPWLRWVCKPCAPTAQPPADGYRYKLYISPMPKQLLEVFCRVAELLPGSPAVAMKIGLPAHGLLRPDKMVVYFDDPEDMRCTAEKLGNTLRGFPAHGVPFTADMGTGGIVSWGVDPPSDMQTVGWKGAESWRLWLTNRLADWMVQAAQSGSRAVQPWRFALERLRLEGVDPHSFAPEGAAVR